MISVEVATALAIKLLAAMSGAVLALIFQPPKTRSEFWTRAAFSIIAGVVFASQVRDYFKWPSTFETDLASGSITALLSWWIMGAVVRIVGAWSPK